MNEVGTIIKGASIGKAKYHNFILRECSNCKERDWVRLYHVNSVYKTNLCYACSRDGGRLNFVDGRFISEAGYVMVLLDHILSYKSGYIPEHRLVAANEWGVEAVKEMVVHHINGDKTDNRIENLELMSRSEHISLHNYSRHTPNN